MRSDTQKVGCSLAIFQKGFDNPGKCESTRKKQFMDRLGVADQPE